MSDITTIASWLGSGSINLFGLPYAGKDTQGKLLANEFGAQVLGGGEILRNSVIPQHVKDVVDAGNLVPTQDFVDIVLPFLSKQEFQGQPLVLSSVGRWHGEEKGVMQVAEQSGHQLKAVVFLSIDEQVLYERWEIAQATGDRGLRADDARKKLSTRLTEFQQKTIPVIEYYRDKGLLIEVDASKHVIDVCHDIISALAKRAAED